MSAYYSDDQVTLYHGDCLDVLAELPDASVHAVVTDPPYGLEFMGKEWDSFKPASDRLRTRVDGRTNPSVGRSVTTTPEAYVAGRPFQDWCEQWTTECLRVLKPGGYLLAFGGTRTYHRLTCAIEDAGFEIRDGMNWLYGSGFPKSLDVGKAIDKRPGVERHPEFAAMLKAARIAKGYTNSFDVSEKVLGARTGAVANWEKYQFPEAKWWPALRDLLDLDHAWDVVIAEAERRKIGTCAGSRLAVAPGQGMDRSAAEMDITAPATDAARQWQGWGTALKPAHEPIVMARKPLLGTVAANVLEHGTGALNIEACRVNPGTPVTGGGVWSAHKVDSTEGWDRPYVNGTTKTEAHTAGRWPSNVVLTHGDCADACAPGCPVAELDRQGGSSGFFPVFRYQAKAPASERPKVKGTAHPTVKPLALMRWLVRLVTPPGGTVLDPFLGSGTTADAARMEGFRCIGIEREAEYLDLIRDRLTQGVLPFEDVESNESDIPAAATRLAELELFGGAA